MQLTLKLVKKYIQVYFTTVKFIKVKKDLNYYPNSSLEGIKMIAEKGVVVKVNSVLIPGLNENHIVDIAKKLKNRELL